LNETQWVTEEESQNRNALAVSWGGDVGVNTAGLTLAEGRTKLKNGAAGTIWGGEAR